MHDSGVGASPRTLPAHSSRTWRSACHGRDDDGIVSVAAETRSSREPGVVACDAEAEGFLGIRDSGVARCVLRARPMQPNMPHIPLGRPVTYDDLVALPEHVVGEIVDGELWSSPRQTPRHAKAHTSLVIAIGAAFGHGTGRPDGWLILLEPELHLGAHVLVPDIAGWRAGKMPRLPHEAFFRVAPDWVCEVLSPSTATLDRAKKLGAYAAAGVAFAWLVDPLAQVLEVYRCDDGEWTALDVHRETSVVHAEPFESLALDLSTIWPDDGPVAPDEAAP